jgi:enhancing lycopene biosynthesis protein 2
MTRIGVLLSGCGVKDGAEIHEAVLTLLALDRAGVEVVCMAPDKDQQDVIDHRSDKTMNQKRNMLTESARIARGNIQSIKEIDPSELDGLVIPGGNGAAKSLCTFAAKKEACTVDPEVAALLVALHKKGRPIAALCIAPTILASLFGKEHRPEITVGTDRETAEAIEKMGAQHVSVEPTQVVIDTENRFVTTPCYMTSSRISDVATGAEKAVTALLSLVPEPAHA